MQGAFIVFVVALLLFGVTLLTLRTISGSLRLAREPVLWFYASWLFGLILLALPLYSYYESFNFESGAYLIGVLLAFSAGSVGAAFWGTRRKLALAVSPTVPTIGTVVAPRLAKLIFLLLGLGAAGTSLLFLNSILSGDLSLGARLDTANLAEIRAQHMDGGSSQIGRLFGPASLASAVGGLGIAMALYAKGAGQSLGRLSFWITYLTYITVALNLVTGVAGFGSRMFVVFTLLVALFGYMEGRWAAGKSAFFGRLGFKRTAGTFVLATVSVVLLVVSATVFLEKRVEEQDPQSILYRTHRANFDPLVYELSRNHRTFQYFLFSASYFTTPIPTLAFYLDLPDARQPGPFYGEYNFPAIARWARRLTFTGDPFFWQQARFEIFRPLAQISFGTNVWSTLPRDLMADFGKTGGLVFLAIFGFLMQRMNDVQGQTPTAQRAGLLAYLRLVAGFAGLVSILYLPTIHWALYLALLLVFLDRRRRLWFFRRRVMLLRAGVTPGPL